MREGSLYKYTGRTNEKKICKYFYIPNGTKTPDLMLKLSKSKWYFDGREVIEINRTTFIAEVTTAVYTQLYR